MAAKTASLSINVIANAKDAVKGFGDANSALRKFYQEFSIANDSATKFKVAQSNAFNYVKNNAMTFATAAGAAVATFAVKSVMAFQDLALQAGKFADATGLSTEQASRFIEVAGDIGVEAGTVEKSLNFMNKTLGNSPELFRSLGVEIAYAADGSRDVNGTFLNVVKRLNEIKDPAERAAAATKLLGRGWTEMSELIGMGSEKLSASLAAVSDAKVIDPGEVERARKFRETTDNLKDAWEDFSLTIGESVLPALSDLMSGFAGLMDLIGKMPGGTTGGLEALKKIAGVTDFTVKIATGAFDNFGIGFGNLAGQIDNTSYASEAFRREMGNQVAAVDQLTAEWNIFRGSLNYKNEFMRVEEQITAFGEKWAGVSEEAKQNSAEYKQELNRAQIAVANLFLETAGLATWTQSNRIKILIDTGKLEYALSLINMIKNASTNVGGPYGFPGPTAIPISPTTGLRPPTTTRPPGTISTIRLPHLASGGSIISSGLAMVGERGPELVSLPQGASVIPSIPSRKMLGGGTTVNIQIQAGLVSSPDQVGQQIIEAIRRAERRSGQVFASL